MTKQISDSELIEELHRLSEKFCNGDSPKIKVLEEHGRYSQWTYENRFGSWNDSLEKAGYEKNIEYEVKKEDLIKDYRRVTGEKSEMERATVSDIKKYGKYCTSTYFNHFENWNEILEEAGFDEIHASFQNSGPEHYRWKGGVSFDGYGESWTKQRRKCLQRDNLKCRVCQSKPESSFFDNPDVHHIIPRNEFNVGEEHEEMNDLSNLICLCRCCHVKLEGKWQDASPEEFTQRGREYLNIEQEAEGYPEVGTGSIFDY